MAATAPLVYLIGASGAGKDTVLDAARARFDGDDRVVFARRHITRPAGSGGERHIAVDSATFTALSDAGSFLLHWRGNRLRYGVHHQYGDALTAGRVVVVNGSRAYLAEARRRCPSLVPVLLRVDADILRQRLFARAREPEHIIEERLRRAGRLQRRVPADAAVIDNSGDIGRTVERFCELLRELSREHTVSAD
jgi:ribose 1,5-bisphosphokinase